MNQGQNLYQLKETKQKYKRWPENEARRTNKETSRTNDITKEEKYIRIQSNEKIEKTTADKTENTTERHKPKILEKERKTEKIPGQ